MPSSRDRYPMPLQAMTKGNNSAAIFNFDGRDSSESLPALCSVEHVYGLERQP